MSDLDYISAESLVPALTDSKETIVVDVRENGDFSAGHIKNAVNLPSGNWQDQAFVDAQIAQYSGSKNIVFHCAKSQQRGPTCAQIFLNRLNETKAEETNVPAV